MQERVHEAHHGHSAHSDVPSWMRTVSLTTAIFAVFAAVGALQAGGLVNEAMMSQIRASDTWNEYQASREKSHLYTVGRDILNSQNSMLAVRAESGASDKSSAYAAQIEKEDDKGKELSAKAKELVAESEHLMRRHERFAYQVALMQVSIALGAVSALTKVKSVWMLSMALGIIGIALFAYGFMG